MRNEPGTFRAKKLTALTALLCVVLLASAVAAGAPSAKKPTPAPAKSVAKNESAPQGLPMLIDVGADKCIPCKMMAPILEDLKKEYTGILEVKFVDVWKYPDQADKYHVKGIPTQIFYDATGKELGRHMGFMDREGIIKGFQDLGIILRKPSEKQVSQAQ